MRKENKNSTPTIALKLQVHDTLSPHMREHVYHLRITGSCSERATSCHHHLVIKTTHHIQYKSSSTECSYLLPLFSVPVAQGGSAVRRGQLEGRRRQYQRGKRQPPRSHHSAAGCVNDCHVCVCACGEEGLVIVWAEALVCRLLKHLFDRKKVCLHDHLNFRVKGQIAAPCS